MQNLIGNFSVPDFFASYLIFFSSSNFDFFGRTELIIGASKAKFDVEADGEVRLSLNPQKPREKHKKLFFRSNFFSIFFFGVEK